MRLEACGYIVAYCDTDSLLCFRIQTDAPALEQLCQISDRLGCLKVEKEGICKFFCTAAKTYSLETTNGEVSIKAKGFNLLEKLLKDNSKECLLEKNITKMFTGVGNFEKKPNPSSLIFQKQIKVNSYHMVPALLPKDKSYKLLNFIGPRRLVDLDNWVDFSYERILTTSEEEPEVVDPLNTIKPLEKSQGDSLFSCGSEANNILARCSPSTNITAVHKVLLIPKIKGLLPAIPYGFFLDDIVNILPYYKLAGKEIRVCSENENE